MAEQIGAFGSPKELAKLLESVGLRLYAKYRIEGGESIYLWHLAETIRGAGRLAGRFDAEPEVHALFCDGHNAGTVPFAEQREMFFQLLTEPCGTA
jgi:hypothetical protein